MAATRAAEGGGRDARPSALKNALQAVDTNTQTTVDKTPQSSKLRENPLAYRPDMLTPIQEEPTPKSSVKSFVEDVSRTYDVSPQRLEEELCKVLEGEATEATTVTSPMFNEWLSRLGIKDAINTPVRLELKTLKPASNENVHLKKLIEKVKEVELEIAAEEAKSAAELWDCLEEECGELQEQNRTLREEIEAAETKVTRNHTENTELQKKMKAMYDDLQRTEEESAVLKQHLRELNAVLKKEKDEEKSTPGDSERDAGAKSGIRETAKTVNMRVGAIIAERFRLENKLKVALRVNKQQQNEQREMEEKYASLVSDMKEQESALAEQNKVAEKCQNLLKEKQEVFQRVIEEQKDLRRRCEVSESEKQVACEKALEACEEILLEQAAMREEYERAQKEKGKGFGKVMKAYENALKDISDLQERCKRLEIAKEEACDNAAQGESHLRAKEEAFKIALDEASRKHQSLAAQLEEKERACQSALRDGALLKVDLQQEKDLREKQAQRMMQRDKEVEDLRQTIEFVNLEREQEAKAFDERAKDLETLLENTKKTSECKLTQTDRVSDSVEEVKNDQSPASVPITSEDDDTTSAIGLELLPFDSPTNEQIKVTINLDKPCSTTPQQEGDTASPTHAKGRLVSMKEDVYDAALFHVKYKKFRQRNHRSRSRLVSTRVGCDVSADECRRRATALGLRSSPIFRSKKYSRT